MSGRRKIVWAAQLTVTVENDEEMEYATEQLEELARELEVVATGQVDCGLRNRLARVRLDPAAQPSIQAG